MMKSIPKQTLTPTVELFNKTLACININVRTATKVFRCIIKCSQVSLQPGTQHFRATDSEQ